jgi:hypothetical protein
VFGESKTRLNLKTMASRLVDNRVTVTSYQTV